MLSSACGGGGQGSGDAASDSASEVEAEAEAAGSEASASSDGTSSSSSASEESGEATGDGDGDGDGDIPDPIDCGTPTFEGLRRLPYLQNVGASATTVAWATTSGGAGQLRVAANKDGPWESFDASSRNFDAAYTGEEVDYLAYEARATGLEAGQQYCYEVWEGDTRLAGGLRLETAWTDERSVRILAFGDSGNASAEQLAVRDEFMKRDYDVFLHLGDMAYNDGTFVEFKERVFDIYADLLHRTPTWPTMGNHEVKTDGGQPYLDLYYLPEVALNPAHNEHYYSFDYGDVHFVSLDSNDAFLIAAAALDSSSDTTMLDWLRDDLANSQKPWKVAFFHHPPYSSSERDPNFIVRNSLLPILEGGGVDMVLVGHDHHYERSYAIKEGSVSSHQEGGIFYFVAGAGGAGMREATGDWWTASVNDQKNSFLSLRISGCTAYGEVVALDGELVDSFQLPGC